MKSRNRKAIKYRMLLGLLVAVLMFCGNVKYGYASSIYDTPQYYANWYKINGMSGVMGYIMHGSWTPEEAVVKCIKPAYDAGYVEQKHLEAFCEYYPEAKGVCEANGIPVGGTTEQNKPKPTPEPAYTIEDCDMYMYATTQVNVRSDASTNAGRVGSIEQNGQAHITGKTSNGWYRLEYNGIAGFSVKKYFADKPVEIIEDVTDVPEPTEALTPEPTPVPTAEPTATPVPTEEPNDTKTEIVEPVENEKPAETPVPTQAPVVDEPTEEATADPTVDSTPAPVVDTPMVTEPVEENNFIPWIVLGGVVVVLGVVAVVVLRRKK